MVNPLGKDLVGGSAKALMGGVEVYLILNPILMLVVGVAVVAVVAMGEVRTMARMAILAVATSYPV